MTTLASVDPDTPTANVEDAADYLGVSARTIHRLVAVRAIAHYRVGARGAFIKFARRDLDDYRASTRVSAAS
jgi:excisionase family DNA binding protein